MVGIEGIVVRMVGGEVAGSGGRVTLGTAGMVGSIGIGKDDGIWVLGKGGIVGFGKVGTVGSVGKAVLGIGGSVGNGGNVTLGRDGIGGTVCSRWRAAWVVWVLENDNAKIRDRTEQC
ncbi:Allantoin permease [Actinidia chinensis var. chinensis]|uniref:Allantoin permease n=1 Tax=Actinidia chinensis var. chinensis TaxID=1590841 RepID=A0A2R6RE34_ACTCC|nr:Allantoin permease [Actinidia chinensis var. chinensis]